MTWVYVQISVQNQNETMHAPRCIFQSLARRLPQDDERDRKDVYEPIYESRHEHQPVTYSYNEKDSYSNAHSQHFEYDAKVYLSTGALHHENDMQKYRASSYFPSEIDRTTPYQTNYNFPSERYDSLCDNSGTTEREMYTESSMFPSERSIYVQTNPSYHHHERANDEQDITRNVRTVDRVTHKYDSAWDATETFLSDVPVWRMNESPRASRIISTARVSPSCSSTSITSAQRPHVTSTSGIKKIISGSEIGTRKQTSPPVGTSDPRLQLPMARKNATVTPDNCFKPVISDNKESARLARASGTKTTEGGDTPAALAHKDCSSVLPFACTKITPGILQTAAKISYTATKVNIAASPALAANEVKKEEESLPSWIKPKNKIPKSQVAQSSVTDASVSHGKSPSLPMHHGNKGFTPKITTELKVQEPCNDTQAPDLPLVVRIKCLRCLHAELVTNRTAVNQEASDATCTADHTTADSLVHAAVQLELAMFKSVRCSPAYKSKFIKCFKSISKETQEKKLFSPLSYVDSTNNPAPGDGRMPRYENIVPLLGFRYLKTRS